MKILAIFVFFLGTTLDDMYIIVMLMHTIIFTFFIHLKYSFIFILLVSSQFFVENVSYMKLLDLGCLCHTNILSVLEY